MRVASGIAKHAGHRGIAAQNRAIRVQRDDAGGDAFQNRFHELPAALQLLNGLLQIPCELVDLRTAVAQLCGHDVEGANQHAEFVLRLLGNLVIEIAGGNLAGALSQRLNRHRNLFSEKQRQPHHRKKQKNREEGQNQQHLTLQRAQVLLLFLVFLHLGLDDAESREKIRAGAIARGHVAGGSTLLKRRDAGYEIVLSLRLPDFHAARQRSYQGPKDAGTLADLAAAVFRLFIANDTAADGLPVGVKNPQGVESGGKSMPKHFVSRL